MELPMHHVLIKLLSVGRPFIIGMVHVGPLPGSSRGKGEGIDNAIDEAVSNAKTLYEGGVDALMVEDFYDAPYPKVRADPAVVASMALIVKAVREAVGIPVGVNILRNCGIEAAAVASVTGASFIRVNALSETIVSDQGVIEPIAYDLLRYMNLLGYRPAILADVHVKHASPLAHREIEIVAKETIERGGADAIIVSGEATGSPPSPNEVLEVRKAIKEPLIIGSGVTPSNASTLLSIADGAIVGTYFKIGRKVSASKVKALMRAVKGIKRHA
jgi:membrane complex biogenesis BtpA family protein